MSDETFLEGIVIMLWVLLLVTIIIVVAAGVCFILKRYKRFSFMQKAAEKNKKLWVALLCIPVAVFILLIYIDMYVGLIGMLHLIAFWALCSLIAKVIGKLTKKDIRHDFEGVAAILLTIAYLGAGWYFAHHVYETSYTVNTSKDVGEGIRVAQIADLHLGVTLDGDEFAEQLERIEKTKPDVLVVTGDFVDDDSKKSEMIKACDALGEIETTYGVYFTFGNHDKAYMPESCDYTEEELRDELVKNNVIILEDESVLIDDRFYIIGRQDRSEKKRAKMSELVDGLDKDKYMIVLDHQPNDYDNETESEVDLVLSGHTHGGHVFPAGILGYLMGANDKVYGQERINKTDFVVTSGISGWAIPFKTFAISEYVIIDIE